MFLKDIKDDNVASSNLTYLTISLITIALICLCLDGADFIRLRSVVVRQTEYLASVCSAQGGFQGSRPYGWTNYYSYSYYISSDKAYSLFIDAIGHTAGTSGAVKLNGSNISGGCTLNYKATGTLSGEVTYRTRYMDAFGTFNPSIGQKTFRHSVPVAGFWVYRNTTI